VPVPLAIEIQNPRLQNPSNPQKIKHPNYKKKGHQRSTDFDLSFAFCNFWILKFVWDLEPEICDFESPITV
jgi:hypothetical protein